MESLMLKELFVYGSLREGFQNTSHNYIAQYFSFVSGAKVKGSLNDIAGEHFATPGDGSSFIEGELYRLNDEHDFSYVFGQLDDYEGLINEQGEQPLYRREITEVFTDDGEITQAWLYWYNMPA